MELFLHNKISKEQTLWWNLYSVTVLHVLAILFRFFSFVAPNITILRVPEEGYSRNVSCCHAH